MLYWIRRLCDVYISSDRFVRGDEMRKEKQHWEYNKESSLYDKADYRSKFYTGKWEKAWLKEVASYAVKEGISLYEAMWLKYADKNEHMPSKLFKFFPFNYNSIKCIETNAVFMNNPQNFNDPFDSMLCANENEFLKRCLIEYLVKSDAVNRGILSNEELEQLKYSRCEEREYTNVYKTFDSVVFHLGYDADKKEIRKGNSEIGRILYELRYEYERKLKQLRENTVGITSFADLSDFKLTSYMELWAHYAQNQEGLCVEYDLTQPVVNTNDNAMILGGLLPCNYSAKQIVLSKQKIYKYVNNVQFSSYEKMEFEKSKMLSFLTKSSSWGYENEWRLILPQDVCEIYNHMIPFFPIKAIFVGCRMPADNREFIYQLAQRKKITVYNMEMHEYKFELRRDYWEVDVERYFENKSESTINKLKESQYNFWKTV
jgi:hypothetical protein